MQDKTRCAARKFDVDISAALLHTHGTTDITALTLASGLSADFTLFPAKKSRSRKKASKKVSSKSKNRLQNCSHERGHHSTSHTHTHTHTHERKQHPEVACTAGRMGDSVPIKKVGKKAKTSRKHKAA